MDTNYEMQSRPGGSPEKFTAYLVGDSTVCDYGEDKDYAIPRGGIGMFLGDYLTGNIAVSNLALSGRSSKSFTAEDNYQKLLSGIREGDYLFIQFGHNDAKNANDEDIKLRYTDPDSDREAPGSFKYYLYEYYIKEALDKKARPILVTPVSRRSFDDNGKLKDTHGRYAEAVRELAGELDIPCIDLTRLTEDYYNRLGEEGTKALHAVYKNNTKGEGGLDNTHFNHNGAKCVAGILAEALMGIESDIKNHVDHEALNAPEYMTRAL